MRVNIESSALAEGRFNKLAVEYFDGSRMEAIGFLVLFWFDSQEREFVIGTKEQIMEFFPFFNAHENEEVFEGLIKYSYIKEKDDNLFEIAGNMKHVEKLKNLKIARSDAAKKGNEARWGKKESQNVATVSQAIATSPCSSMQFNSVQCNSNQDKEGKRPQASALPPLVNIWNEFKGDYLPKVQDVGTKRLKSLGLRWKEKPDPNYWETVVKKISQSKFCRGENDRGWKATFDFLIQPDTHIKVMEGKYDPPKTGLEVFAEKMRSQKTEASA